ncbi:MAG: hypothetical protein EXX96DRAFT_486705 [Benjaminiella poitrasii]|nr:MAG: hypothetical protein EXX96DRAFT_486705 [Benjaminiella poitrasii]
MAIAGVTAQVTSPTQTYNVSSPVSNGPYVAGQVLPCTIQLFENIVADLALSITLQPATTGSNVTYTIASSVDTSRTAASAKQNGNTTYYEHSVNYNIPTTITPGSYKVVFADARSATQLDVPINILAVAASSSIGSSSKTGGTSSPTSSGSIFKPDSGAMTMSSSPSKTITALVGVAVLAYML